MCLWLDGCVSGSIQMMQKSRKAHAGFSNSQTAPGLLAILSSRRSSSKLAAVSGPSIRPPVGETSTFDSPRAGQRDIRDLGLETLLLE